MKAIGGFYMSDKDTNLSLLKEIVKEFTKDRDWTQFHFWKKLNR